MSKTNSAGIQLIYSLRVFLIERRMTGLLSIQFAELLHIVKDVFNCQ